MAADERPQAALAFALARLPLAEFAVAAHDRASEVVGLRDDGRLVATVTLVDRGGRDRTAAVDAVTLLDDPQAVHPLAGAVADRCRDLRVVRLLGPGDEVGAVADAVARRLGGVSELAMRQRLWSCDTPWPLPEVAGGPRPARESDRGTLAAWRDAFLVEALGEEPPGDAAQRPSDVDLRDAHVWVVDGELVAMANAWRTTPVSARVGGVFVPRVQRRRGYAAALTAAVTANLLADGLERVVLLTDVANPATAGLYAGIGFVDVGPHGVWLVRRDARG
jgi:predicted GNAT family acetyltransferase